MAQDLWAIKSLQATEATDEGIFIVNLTIYNLEFFGRQIIKLAMHVDLLEDLIRDLTDLREDQLRVIAKRSNGNGEVHHS